MDTRCLTDEGLTEANDKMQDRDDEKRSSCLVLESAVRLPWASENALCSFSPSHVLAGHTE